MHGSGAWKRRIDNVDETILIADSSTVTEGDTASVVVLGNVSERDGFLKGADDSASFRHTYTKANDRGSAATPRRSTTASTSR